MGDWGWGEEGGGVTVMKQIRKHLETLESWEELPCESCLRIHIHVHYHVWALWLYKAGIKRSVL